LSSICESDILFLFFHMHNLSSVIDRKIKIQAKKDHVDLITLFIL